MRGAFGRLDEDKPKKSAPPEPVGKKPDPVAALQAVVSKPKPSKPGKFVPGKRGEPRSGKTAAQLMRDPDVLIRLAAALDDYKKSKVYGPTIREILPECSDAQCRSIAKKINRQMAKMAGGTNYMRKAAAKTAKG